MSNQKGGILSKIFIIPAGVALMVGFFLLGYYVGKYQNKPVVSGEIARQLSETASNTGQKQEEFTFYKTLTDKNNKKVSIDLKPKPVKEEARPVEHQTTAGVQRTIPIASTPKQPTSTAKRGTGAASSNEKLRYTVQTASYRERGMADDEVKRLKKRGFAAYIVSSELPGKGVWHRVRIGSFSNRAGAETLQKTIHEKERILTIVVSD